MTTANSLATTTGRVGSAFSSPDLRKAPRPFIEGGAVVDPARVTVSDHRSSTLSRNPCSRAQISTGDPQPTPKQRRQRGHPSCSKLTKTTAIHRHLPTSYSGRLFRRRGAGEARSKAGDSQSESRRERRAIVLTESDGPNKVWSL
jgi:hypothetical protein